MFHGFQTQVLNVILTFWCMKFSTQWVTKVWSKTKHHFIFHTHSYHFSSYHTETYYVPPWYITCLCHSANILLYHKCTAPYSFTILPTLCSVSFFSFSIFHSFKFELRFLIFNQLLRILNRIQKPITLPSSNRTW